MQVSCGAWWGSQPAFELLMFALLVTEQETQRSAMLPSPSMWRLPTRKSCLRRSQSADALGHWHESRQCLQQCTAPPMDFPTLTLPWIRYRTCDSHGMESWIWRQFQQPQNRALMTTTRTPRRRWTNQQRRRRSDVPRNIARQQSERDITSDDRLCCL